jgi:hypothetical protein
MSEIFGIFQSSTDLNKVIILFNENLYREDNKFFNSVSVINTVDNKVKELNVTVGTNGTWGEINLLTYIEIKHEDLISDGDKSKVSILDLEIKTKTNPAGYKYSIEIAHQKPEKISDFAVAAIIRDETQFIAEWVTYYYHLGVRKFYLYDNHTKDVGQFKSLVSRLNDRYAKDQQQLVTLIHFGVNKYLHGEEKLKEVMTTHYKFHTYVPQCEQITHAIYKYGGYHKRLILCDVDEFLVISKGSSLADSLKYDNIIIHTYSFGCKLFDSKEDNTSTICKDSIIGNYRYRKPQTEGNNMRTKCIINPELMNVMSVHRPISSFGSTIISPSNMCSSFVFNHYMNRRGANLFYREAAIKQCAHGDLDSTYDDTIIKSLSSQCIKDIKEFLETKTQDEPQTLVEKFRYYSSLSTVSYASNYILARKAFLDLLKTLKNPATSGSTFDEANKIFQANIGRLAVQAMFYNIDLKEHFTTISKAKAKTRRAFDKYKGSILVETGTYLGEGITDALNNGFQRVISFEITNEYYNRTMPKFISNSKIKMILGSSVSMLYQTIKDINEPIVFWLDANYSGGDAGYDPQYINPLLKELEQIGKHHIKTHTILIDDRRLLKPSTNKGLDSLFDITEAQIREALLKINPDYIITYEDGYIPDDIIVAMI